MDEIYLIKRLFLNQWYVWGERKYQYVAVGFAMTRDEAVARCEGCYVFKKEQFSILKDDMPEYIFIAVPRWKGHKLYERYETIEEAIGGH